MMKAVAICWAWKSNDLDMSQLEDFELNILQDVNEETTELPLEQRIAGIF